MTHSWFLLHLCITFLDVLEGIGSFWHDNNNQAAMTADKSNSCKEQVLQIMTEKIQHEQRKNIKHEREVETPLHLSEAVREMHACELQLRLSESRSEP